MSSEQSATDGSREASGGRSEETPAGRAASEASRKGLHGPTPEQRERPRGRRSKQGVRVDPDAEATHAPRRTTISALVKHEPGVLAEVAGLVSRRQFDIESLTVGPTTNPETARVTLVVEEPEPGVRQVEKQLEKLVPVVSVRELGRNAIRRELVLLKVHGDRPEAVQAVTEMFDGRTLDAGPWTITVELTANPDKVEDAIDAFRQFGIRELTRTGSTALAAGEEWTTDAEEERYERMTDAGEYPGYAESRSQQRGQNGQTQQHDQPRQSEQSQRATSSPRRTQTDD
ncbi:MAG: acetolactate synthase small subunit [Halolamina sp.]|uniref:acetolactate synthase small subunit n=1 Tax=Halolamina sp. TaxID=1940283 RepID=UPI002FC38D8C